MKTQRFIIAALLLMGASLFSQAQHYQKRYISTAVPFLTIAPDVRGASLGFSGVATSPDAFSMFYICFHEKRPYDDCHGIQRVFFCCFASNLVV